MKPCPQDCEGSWSDWTPNPDACDVQPSESRIYSITKPAVGNTQFGYGRPCEEIHDKVETRSRQDPIQPCCTQNHDWVPAFSAHGGTCKPNGTGIFAQTTIGNCPDDVKSAYKACCYESGEWRDVGECQMNGKQKQVQATNGNCLESVKTREIDCCWRNEWTDVGECNSNGEQSQARIVAGSCEAVRSPKDPAACAEAKQVSKEGVKGVRYVKFGYKDKINNKSRGNWTRDAYHGKAGLPFDNYLNIAGIEIYSGGENIVKNWDRETELLKGVTVNSSWENDDPTTGTYGTARLFDGNSNTMYHSGLGDNDNYFQIDLGKEYTIDEVKVINRQDSNDPRDPWRQRWQGAVLELLDSSKSVLKTGGDITAADTVNTYRTYRFAISPATLAQLAGILDMEEEEVPEDLSTLSNNTWMQIEPACALGDPVDESDTSRTLDCLYVGDWDRQWGVCNGSKRYKYRTVKNPDLSLTGSPPSTQQEQSCANCKGEWRQEYGHKWAARGRKRHHRVLYQKFHMTRNAYNGGSCGGVPSNGTTRNHTQHRQKEGDMDWHNHVLETIYGG
jgi:hypothetical protein